MKGTIRIGNARRLPGLIVALFIALLGLLTVPAALAHKASDAYLVLGDGGAGVTRMQLSLSLKDLDAVLELLDANNDRQLTWAETRGAMPAIIGWVDGGASFRCGASAVPVAWQFESLERRGDGAYVRLAAPVSCAAAPLDISYQLMKDVDPTHRLLVSGQLDGIPLATVLSPQGRGEAVLRQPAGAAGAAGAGVSPSGVSAALPVSAQQGGLATLSKFFAEGVHHIVTGYDHLVFLLVLLLPISLYRRSAPAAGTALRARSGLLALFTTVTGFTIGHSLTLVLATLGFITASPGWVEPAIAITIAVSALLNLFPVRHLRSDVLALVFGMIHGLGFSGVMTEAGVTGSLLLWALAGFNLGVEAGQLAGVAVWCCIHLALARWAHYERVVIRGGSWLLLVLALYWTFERSLG